MKRTLIAAVILMVGVLHAQNTDSTPYSLDKKLIEYGWDVPYSNYVKDNITRMEKRPFDGLIFKLQCGGMVLQTKPVDKAKLAKDYADCQAIKWNKFTDNFIILWAASNQDWFNDDDWNVITDNTRKMVHAAKLARCVGICFDHEPYGFNPWSYKNAKHHTQKSFAEYEAIVRKRGAQFMKAAESEMPGLVVLTFFQLSYFSNLCKPMPPANRAKNLSGHTYAFLPAFLNGMLDAASPAAQIVDGNESAYYYTDSNSYFEEYQRVRQRAKLLIAAENQFKYHNQMQVGQALYIDQYFALRSSKVLSYYMSPAEQAKWFEHNVYWALYSSDKYVWCYSECMDWWKDKVPAGAEQAIINARTKLNAGKSLDFNMKGIADKANASRNADIAKQLKIKKANVQKLPAKTPKPVLDGKLNDPAWQSTKPLDNFNFLAESSSNKKLPATIPYITYDNDNLYLAFICKEDAISKLSIPAEGHDDESIWLGDDLEIFIAPKIGKTLPFLHFIIDPKNNTWDAKHSQGNDSDLLFNPKWQSAASIDKNEWRVEIAIPWASLGITMPKPGTTLRANFCRQRIAGTSSLSAWSCMASGFLEHALFGYLNFVE